MQKININTITNVDTHIEKLKKELQRTNGELKRQPEGELEIGRNGKYCNFYCNKNGKLQYLSKKYPDDIAKLVRKRFLHAYKSDIETEIKALASYKSTKNNNRAGEVERFANNKQILDFLNMSMYNPEEIKDLFEWAKEDYKHNESHPENLIHKTIDGHVVRSKSEAMICELLASNGIPYRYEEGLQLDSFMIYPDFTIKRPRDRKVFYWEHFGLFDKPGYRTEAIRKIGIYSEYFIYPGNNLILTYETPGAPLTQQIIQQTIEMYLL